MEEIEKQTENKLTSKPGTITTRDWIQSIIMTFLGAFLSTVVMIIQPILGKGSFDIDWRFVLASALGAGAAQLLRKFLQNENGNIIEK